MNEEPGASGPPVVWHFLKGWGNEQGHFNDWSRLFVVFDSRHFRLTRMRNMLVLL